MRISRIVYNKIRRRGDHKKTGGLLKNPPEFVKP